MVSVFWDCCSADMVLGELGIPDQVTEPDRCGESRPMFVSRPKHWVVVLEGDHKVKLGYAEPGQSPPGSTKEADANAVTRDFTATTASVTGIAHQAQRMH